VALIGLLAVLGSILLVQWASTIAMSTTQRSTD
jgi:hypothetical protein